jgi:hypothetical protein
VSSFRIGPKDGLQADHILAHLERADYQIVKVDRDTGVTPSNLGG